MITTLPSISRVTQDVENTPSLARIPSPASELNGCQRCGGNLVNEHCMDIGEGGSGHRLWAMRCIQCGDIIDETILRNRFSSVETLEKLRSHTKRRKVLAVAA